MHKFAHILLAGALALSPASIVHAKDDVSVEFKSALLDTQSGTQGVYRQMARAARHSCADSGLVGRYPGLVRSCRAAVLNDLVRNAKSPALTAMHTDGRARVIAAKDVANAKSM